MNHDYATILYLSTHTITPCVSLNNRYLLNEIVRLLNMDPNRVICAVRVTSPSQLSGNMKNLQQRAVDILRDKCYVSVYSQKRDLFLNHAKFLIYYHICFSEKVAYHAKFYGSTNFTQAGFCSRSGKYRYGNYEEFQVSRPNAKPNLTSGDMFYFKEIQNIVTSKGNLYTSPSYLKNYLTDHREYLQEIMDLNNKVLSGTTLGDLFEAYIESSIAYLQTLSLFDEIPGKKYTFEIIEKLRNVKSPETPFELEMMIPENTDSAQLVAEYLELTETELRDSLKRINDVLGKSYKSLKEYEQKMLEKNELRRYLDDRELKFLELLKNYYNYHTKILNKIIQIIKERGRL